MEDSSYKNVSEGPKEEESEESCDVKIQPIDIVWRVQLKSCQYELYSSSTLLVFVADVFISSLPLAPECKCNGHAQSCHFDWTAWRESGQRSGGVCDCLHNTEGRQCQKCKAGFYRDPQRPQAAPDSCKRKIHKHRMYLSKLWRWFVIGIIWSI